MLWVKIARMPELPEVETIVRRYRRLVVNRRIVAFRSRWARQVTPSVARVKRAIVGRTVVKLSRRAKYIVFHLDQNGYLLVHLRMSGRLEWAADHATEPPHVRAYWDFNDGNRLLFCDSRKFGRIVHGTDLKDLTRNLGPEPLERRFTADCLARILAGRSRQIKPLLLDQSIIVGLGNIYADEALHRAGIHPVTRADRLNPRQIAALHESIRYILRKGIRHSGTTFDWIYPSGGMQKHLSVYGRTDEPCPTCNTPIEYLRVAQRGTHICPRCQPVDGVRQRRRKAASHTRKKRT
ncbi:MAG: DNA-formamidopyrimidine glycosylase [Planctomycetota bacterium]